MTADERSLSEIARRLAETRASETPDIQTRPALRLPVRVLDRFLGEFLPGTVTLLDSAHPYVRELVGMLCVQSVGRLCGDVLYIDGGNSFDPYGLMLFARRLGVDKDPVLDNVKVARAFTAHQMTSLLHDMLGRELERHAEVDGDRPMTVVVSDLVDLYLDEDVNRAEAKGMLDLVTRRLTELTEEHQVTTVVSNQGLSKLGAVTNRKALILSRFHRVIRIERTLRDRHLPEPRRWHPFMGRPRKGQGRMYLSIPSEGKAMVFYPAPRNQHVLDDYGDLGVSGIPFELGGVE